MRTVPLILVFALFVAACGVSSSDDETTTTTAQAATTTAAAPTTTAAPMPTASAEITISGFSFGAPITVGPGTTVVVTNDDGITHTWTSRDGLFSSGGLDLGESFEFTFEEPGEYEFFCSIHREMVGSITVEG